MTTSTGFAVLLGNGDGTFQPPEYFITAVGGLYIATGDLNSDGHPDLAVVVANSNDVYVYLGSGAGGFSGPMFAYLPGQFGSSNPIAVGDVNGDGIPDLVNGTGEVAVGRGNGTFRLPALHPVDNGFGSYQVALTDLRHNGRTDIVVQDVDAVSVLLNEGKGQFEDGIWTYPLYPLARPQNPRAGIAD